jgi:hypothetical protein
MKNLIRHILKEETNKSLKLFTNLYDIEDNGSVYRGENRFQTYVTFYPKDYDNEMTREAGTSICNWEIDDDGELIFKFMSLPQPYLIPLMNYIGDTEDLEDYLEDIHVEEAEKFLKRINHRRNNPLKEDVDKDKKFLTSVMGVDFTGNIQQVTSLYDIPYNFYRKGIFTMPDVASYLNRFGPMYIIELYGRKFIYQDRGRYESFISEDGIVYEDKIPEQLGIDIMGLRFSDIIDIYFNEEDEK